MPQMNDITIKKADGTTDVVYAGVSPSAGDTVPAVWKSTTQGTTQASQPELRATARSTRKGRGRAIRSTFQFPVVLSDGSLGTPVYGSWDFSYDRDTDQGTLNDASSQFGNAVASAIMTSIRNTGYSAT